MRLGRRIAVAETDKSHHNSSNEKWWTGKTFAAPAHQPGTPSLRAQVQMQIFIDILVAWGKPNNFTQWAYKFKSNEQYTH